MVENQTNYIISRRSLASSFGIIFQIRGSFRLGGAYQHRVAKLRIIFSEDSARPVFVASLSLSNTSSAGAGSEITAS